MKRSFLVQSVIGVALGVFAVGTAQAADVGTAFTFQGRLENDTPPVPVTDTCDFRFGLWNAAVGGGTVGATPLTLPSVFVDAGLFTVVLDFGAGAFDGSARWLEMEVMCPLNPVFILLEPRVELTPAPYALALPGLYTQQNATSPNLIGGYSGNTVTAGALGATIGGGGYSGSLNRVTDDYGTIGGGANNRAGDNAGTTADRIFATVGGGIQNTASGIQSTVGGGAGNTASGSFATVGGGQGNIASGIQSTVGGGVLNTASGDRSTVGGGIGNTASEYGATVPGGNLNEAGGQNSFSAGSRAHVRGIVLGDPANDNGTFVWADTTAADFISSGTNQFLIRASGGVGMGTASATAPRAQLDVVKSGATVAVFDRTTSDGTIISLRQAGTEEGTISVLGAVVSYNAFTGSHYGWTDEAIACGTLVTLTGVNRSLHDNPESERIYGIAPTTKANDPQCLGAYLGLLEPAKPQTSENPHQVMAVGNGDMWVIDTGRNIEPGQYLLSSDVKGHAMLDDESRFPVGYVIARAGEPVDWSTVNDAVDGRKHKTISVFFESFERGSAVAVGKSVVAQQDEIDALKSRVAALEFALTANAPSARPASLASVGGFAIAGLAALGFVGLIVRSRTQNGGGQ